MFIIHYLNKFDLPILSSLILLPLISFFCIPIYLYNYGIVWQELIMLFVGWFVAGTGITVGYHRLFSHRSFKTYYLAEWLFMIAGSMALQNTILNWCSDHRLHHKKLDTKDDPYSITKGFFHAHIGWIVKKSGRKIIGVDDLKNKSAVKFQTKYYWIISLFLSFALPFLIGCLYGRPFGGLLFGGVLRVTLVHHFTFFINSFCHFIGKRNYDINTSARDSWIMALFTFGEGYHNFHHKFQWDYRNGIKWYNFDPSKWIIKSLSYLKIAYGLRQASEASILKAKFDTINNKIKIILNRKVLIKDKYNTKITKITNIVFLNLKSLKDLEQKYQLIKFKNFSKRKELWYKKKISLCKLELKNSFSSLMLIFLNLKNLS